jgi:hypothetical protein
VVRVAPDFDRSDPLTRIPCLGSLDWAASLSMQSSRRWFAMDDEMAPADVEVRPWTEECVGEHHDEVWSAWLHGSVAALHDAGRLLLLVPMAVVTPAAVLLALRLYRLGAVALLD